MADDPHPAERYAWGQGDIEIIRRGSGGPLLSEEELARILRENPEPTTKPRTNDARSKRRPWFLHIHRRR